MDSEAAGTGIRDIGALGPVTVEMLRDTFPKWRIFSQFGSWWATREGEQRLAGAQSLIRCVLVGSDLPVLGDKLCLQEWLDSLDALALDAVWREMAMPGGMP